MRTSSTDSRKRWLATAGIAFVLLLVLLAALLLAKGGQHSAGSPKATAPGHASASPSSPSPGAAHPGAAQSTGCRTATPTNAMPTSPPRDVKWKNVGAFLVPTSGTYGPTRYQGPVWSCYSHTPMGAVMASSGILATLTGPDWKTVAEHEIMPGPGQEAFIAAGEKQKYTPPAPGSVSQPVGFQVVSYSPMSATVEALVGGAGSQYTVTEQTLAWSGGDWKLVVTPSGTTGPDAQTVSSSAGFVLWGAAGA